MLSVSLNKTFLSLSLINFIIFSAQAMYFLWSHKVAHMDLKPQNILLTSSSNPTIKIAGESTDQVIIWLDIVMIKLLWKYVDWVAFDYIFNRYGQFENDC